MHEIHEFDLEGMAYRVPEYDAESTLNLVDYGIASEVKTKYASDRDTFMAYCPVQLITGCLPRKHLKLVAQCHRVFVGINSHVAEVCDLLNQHQCTITCSPCLSVFKPVLSNTKRWQKWCKKKATDCYLTKDGMPKSPNCSEMVKPAFLPKPSD